MNRMVMMCFCLILVVALAIPAFAGRAYSKRSAVDHAYNGGVMVVEKTEGLITGILKSTFKLFNPCLDIVKGCTNIVLAPVDVPFNMLSKATSKPRKARKSSKVPLPKKPELPKK